MAVCNRSGSICTTKSVRSVGVLRQSRHVTEARQPSASGAEIRFRVCRELPSQLPECGQWGTFVGELRSRDDDPVDTVADRSGAEAAMRLVDASDDGHDLIERRGQFGFTEQPLPTR